MGEREKFYVGGSRPHYFTVDASEIEDDATENDLRTLFYNMADEHMRQSVNLCCLNEDEFVEWAKAQQGKGE